MDFDCNSDGPKCDPLKDLGFDGPLYIPILWMIVHLISTRILAYLILRHIKLK